MGDKRSRVCPVEMAGSLDNRMRRWVQDPRKILGPYVKVGMTVMDLGCGPGFFSIDMAHMVGNSGRVIASDLQEGMLQKIRAKIQGTALEKRISLHKCEQDRIGVFGNLDFVLAFYMIHEVPNPKGLFEEIFSILKRNEQFLIVEPKLFHVSKRAFEETVRKAKEAGFEAVEEPKIFFSRSTVFRKG